MIITAKVMIEGIGLGALLSLVCALGICRGAIGMAHMYDKNVQERVVSLGLTTADKIKANNIRFKSICIPCYLVYLFVCVYGINHARGFAAAFWQMFIILFIMNLIDRFFIDDYWVNHTKTWIIPGTEDLRPYITAEDKKRKWLVGTVGIAAIAAVLAGIMCLFIK